MKNHTESSKMHKGHQAAKPWGRWTSTKSRQWKNSIENQNIQPWCHLGPELEQAQLSSWHRTPHAPWGGELPTAVLEMHLLRKWIFPGNFSFAEQHRSHQVLGVLLCGSSQKDLKGWWAFCSQPSGAKQPTDTTGAAGKCFWLWKTGNVTRCTKCSRRKAETLILKNSTWKRCSSWKLILLHQTIKEENTVKITNLSFYTATVFYLRFPLRPAVMVALIQCVPIWALFH